MTQVFQASTRIDIDAPPARVWQTLVEPDLVARYMHGAEVDTDWSVGSPIVWRGEWQGRSYADKGEVLAFDPPRRLGFTHWSPLTGEPDIPANYHHVTYELEPLPDGRTGLTLTHGNSPSQEAADSMVATGWTPMMAEIGKVAAGD
jgi:uncharacterized protein YndB with AHSA1/START domain